MKTDDELDSLPGGKVWSELTAREKRHAIEILGSEEAYNAFCKVDTAIDNLPKADITPSPQIWLSLQNKFRQHARVPVWQRILFFRVPGYAFILAILAMVVLMYTFQPDKPSVKISTVVKTDTLYVATKPDTVYLTRFVYKNVYTKGAPDVMSIVKHDAPNDNGNAVGVSMKEKEELENLLVSGSE